MIEKLNLEEVDNPGEATLKAFSILNQLVDAVNELQNRIDPPSVYQVMKDKDAIIGKHIGEKQRLQDELERIRKALDRAKWWLHEIVENHRYTPISTAEMALKEITALEQKD